MEAFEAEDKNQNKLSSHKIRKNAWRVEYNSPQVLIKYRVYAFDLTVRTSFIDQSHGYVNGASIFMYIEGFEKESAELEIIPYEKWTSISTSLLPKKNTTHTFIIPNYDVLVDSPIEIGNQETLSFKVEGITHKAAIYGFEEIPKKDILIHDIQSIVTAAKSIFGEIPSEEYTFIIHFAEKNGGGLEHANSTSLKFSRELVQSPIGYKQFLSLLAHEYFHLWNVKRLRPAPLGPFDYNQENYTTLLWQAEGFTSYYEKLILLNSRLITEDDYLNTLAEKINYIENQPGSQIQSLSDASMDAWIKAYRPHENSHNTTISYYTKGAVIALLLDISLIHHSKTSYTLDDVMRYLYHIYFKKHNRGFTENELRKAVEKFLGFDLREFFEKYINGTEEIDYAQYLNYAGLELIHEPIEGLNIGLSLDDNVITQIKRNSCAEKSGLNVDDKILSINKLHINNLDSWLAHRKEGEQINIQFVRDGIVQELSMVLSHYPIVNYKIITINSPSEEQQRCFSKLKRMLWEEAENY